MKTTRRRSWSLLVAAAAAALLAACSSTLGPVPVTSDSSSPRPSTSPTSSPDTGTTPAVQLVTLVEGLDAPIDLLSLPGGDLLVAEQGGTLLRVQMRDGSAVGAPQTVGTLDSEISFGGERGLLGIVLHPAWGSTSPLGVTEERLFLNYTRAGDGATIVASVRFDGTNIVGTPTPLLEIAQPFPNHNGGDLIFRSDGMLIVPTGDGGSGGDPLGHAQRATSLLGKVLLLDVDAPQREPEVWLYGVRNPWRVAIDERDGSLWIADVGQDATEEVTRVPADAAQGSNLGWNIIEGDRCFGAAACREPNEYLAPIAVYRHEGGACSISGGAHLDDPSGAHWFVVVDWCDGLVRGVRSDAEGGNPSDAFATLGTAGPGISGIVADAARRVWALDHSGGRIARVSLVASGVGSAGTIP